MKKLTRLALPYLASCGGFLVLSFFVLRPDSLLNESTLPIHEQDLQTVALFNAWTIWWNAHSSAQGFAGYWDAPIFYPDNLTFAFSEPQPATLIVAPVIWCGSSPTFAYKLYLLFALLLNGLVTMAIVRNMHRPLWISFFAGSAMLLLPIVHGQIGVLQLVPVWGIIWTWASARKLGQSPTLWRGAVTGLAFGSVFLTSVHHGLCLTILLTASFWLIPLSWNSPRLIGAGLIAVAVGASIVLPVAFPIRAAALENGFHRDQELVQRLSARMSHYGSVPVNPFLHAEPRRTAARYHLSPGWIKVSLAAIALAAAAVRLKRLKRHRWTTFLFCTGILSVFFSLGPNLKLGSWEPWVTLSDWYPSVSLLRSAYRFAYFAQIAVVLLAVEGLFFLSLLRRRWFSSGWKRNVAKCGLFAVALAALLETWPARPMLAGTPDLTVERSWISYLRKQTPARNAIACIPFAQGTKAGEYFITAHWMYLGTSHGRPLVNGYSGFFPEGYRSLKQQVNESFPSESVFSELASRSVEFVVVLRSAHTPAEILSASGSEYALKLVHEDPDGIDVYRLQSRVP